MDNVKWLLDHGSPWNMVDNGDNTAADVALDEGHPLIHDIILEYGVQKGMSNV